MKIEDVELTDFYKQFGLVIFDEAHFMCCKSYSKALLQILLEPLSHRHTQVFALLL